MNATLTSALSGFSSEISLLPSKAVKIRTDYLSKEQGEAKMKEDTSLTENPYLLKAFDGSKEISEENPDNADVKVAFKVV